MSTLNVGTIASKTGNSSITIADNGIASIPGHVLQVQNSVINSGSSNSQVTVRTAYLTVNITPSATSSKILVNAQGAGSVICGSSGILQAEIFRGDISSGTMIATQYSGLGSASNGHEHYITAHLSVVDSPNTTSTITYTFAAVKGSGGTTSSRIMGGAAFPITMYAMEIAQ